MKDKNGKTVTAGGKLKTKYGISFPVELGDDNHLYVIVGTMIFPLEMFKNKDFEFIK